MIERCRVMVNMFGQTYRREVWLHVGGRFLIGEGAAALLAGQGASTRYRVNVHRSGRHRATTRRTATPRRPRLKTEAPRPGRAPGRRLVQSHPAEVTGLDCVN